MKNFQYSLWDPPQQQPQHIYLNPLNLFQYSLWDSTGWSPEDNSKLGNHLSILSMRFQVVARVLIEPWDFLLSILSMRFMYLPEVLKFLELLDFQYSLWDSKAFWGKTHSSLDFMPFNTLYEIPTRLESSQRLDALLPFNTLYEIPSFYLSRGSFWSMFSLSILSMRFITSNGDGCGGV